MRGTVLIPGGVIIELNLVRPQRLHGKDWPTLFSVWTRYLCISICIRIKGREIRLVPAIV